MRTLNDWLNLYGKSHQNSLNKKIHYVCVPLIMFSILGILWAISPWLDLVLIILAMVFYIRLSWKVAALMLILTLVMLLVVYLMTYKFAICLIIFIVSWLFQFVGHKIEGKKPSFIEDLQFLLVGPAWIMNELFLKKK